jgi:hypothetical protein
MLLADPPVPYPNMGTSSGGSKIKPHMQTQGSSGDESGTTSGHATINLKSNSNNNSGKKNKKKKSSLSNKTN